MSSPTPRPATVRAATLNAPYSLAVKEYPYPTELEPGAVLLKMIASGICGTDKHTYRGETKQYVGTEFERTTPFPIIQGHENLGEVAAVRGEAIAFDGTQLEVGDRVVPAPNRACGKCRNCLRDYPYYMCRSLENYGNSLTSAEPPHLFGGWSEYLYLRPGTPIFKVPAGLRDDVAVLTEIFAVTHSLERAALMQRPNGFRPGDVVAVVGVGSLGMAHAVKAWMMGASRVIAIDPSEKRRALAKRLIGAVGVDADLEGVRVVRSLTGGDGADVVINATGFPGSFGTALELVRDGGTILEVGAFVHMGDEPFNPATICGRSLAILGVGGEDPLVYEATLALLARYQDVIPLDEMISHSYPLWDVETAMKTAQDPTVSAKVLIKPNTAEVNLDEKANQDG